MKVALLIKSSSYHPELLEKYYLNPLSELLNIAVDIETFSLNYTPSNKAPVGLINSWIAENENKLKEFDIIFCADANYYRGLLADKKTYGKAYSVPVPSLLGNTVIYGMNYSQLAYNEGLSDKFDLAITTLVNLIHGVNKDIGSDNLKDYSMNFTEEEVETVLQDLLKYPVLAVDIETTNLNPHTGKIATCSFAYCEDKAHVCVFYNKLFRKFLDNYKGKLIFHNSTFDLSFLIHKTYMSHMEDYRGLTEGIVILTKDIEDTRLQAYLCYNTTAQTSSYSLKALSYEWSGDYAIDTEYMLREAERIQQVHCMKGISEFFRRSFIPLFKYNAIDTVNTFKLFHKQQKLLKEENQVEQYENVAKAQIKLFTHVNAAGITFHIEKFRKAYKQLNKAIEEHSQKILNSPYTEEAIDKLTLKEMKEKNLKLKVKQHSLDTYPKVVFNCNSPVHVRTLLYDVLGFTPKMTTKSGLPSTDKKAIAYCKATTEDTKILDILNDLSEYTSATTVLSLHMQHFLYAADNCVMPHNPEYAKLYGSYTIFGAKSTRASSSKPNLQNIPSKSKYGKLLKSFIHADNKEYVMLGLDSNAFEDRTNTILTKDENKLKVYCDGYDGHSLRASAYFPERMPDLDFTQEISKEEHIKLINSIEDLYPDVRDASKPCTFALQYKGTYMTLVTNAGLSIKKAKEVTKAHAELYKTAEEWGNAKILEASKKGYAELAYGIKLRCPILKRVYLDTKTVPQQAQKDIRTVWNAVTGQSYCNVLTMNTASFMDIVYENPDLWDKIIPILLVHDAAYFIVKNDSELITRLNISLVDNFNQTPLKELKHPEVGFESSLEIYPTWKDAIKIPNNVTEAELRDIVEKYKETKK